MYSAKYVLKIAAVPRSVKAVRRATLDILSGNNVTHGTDDFNLKSLLAGGKINPGHTNLFSPKGVREVYLGYGGPADTHMNRKIPGVSFPAFPLLNTQPSPLTPRQISLGSHSAPRPEHVRFYKDREIPARIMEAPYTAGPTDAKHWLITPHAVNLPPKTNVIAQPEDMVGTREVMKERRYRHIPSDVYYRQKELLQGAPRLSPAPFLSSP